MMLNINDDLLQTYVFYGAIVAFKVFIMAGLTRIQRNKKKVFANPEDVTLKAGSTVSLSDPDVERVRRAHQNDVENVFLYLFVSAHYVYTLARCAHTYVYLNEIRTPARQVCFFMNMFTIAFMLFNIVFYTF